MSLRAEESKSEIEKLKPKALTPAARSPTPIPQHPSLRNPNIIPRRILHHIHHPVGLPDDIMRRPRVMRIRRHSNRRPHIQIQSFFLQKQLARNASRNRFATTSA